MKLVEMRINGDITADQQHDTQKAIAIGGGIAIAAGAGAVALDGGIPVLGRFVQTVKNFLGFGGDGAADAAGDAAARALSKSEEKAISSLEKHIAEHEQKIADFKENPTVRPGMENLPKDVIEAQQTRRLEHLQQEIDAAYKNIRDILNGTSNAGK
jgi:hypothetical protein